MSRVSLRPHMVAALAGCLIACSTYAADSGTPEVSAVTSSRPRVGLVLAGGGAKGGAHVGVLKVLEEMHIPIDCIAGTSMGALVGGGYASGIPADELEKFVVGIDWKKVVGGAGQRDLQTIEQKRAGATYSNDIEMGLREKRVILPAGILNTSNIEDLLRSYVAASRLQGDFDKLPIPYRAVATDMISGKMVVLKDGDLATAMRASMAIPGAFAPVMTEQYILSDGGMVRNIPVDVARNLCADVVIVVNLVEQELQREKLQTATQLILRSSDVGIMANENLQLESLTDRDIRVDVIMGDITTTDFERVPETIPLGEKAAREMAAKLAPLAVPEAEYHTWRAGVTAGQNIETRLADVQYKGMERVNPEYLEGRAQVKSGDKVDTATISAEAQRMSALPEFESVEYRLTGDPGGPTLEWWPQEKTYGPNYLKFDLGLYGSEDGDLGFVVYAKHTRTWLNSLGAEWRNEIQLGYFNNLSTSFYQPLDVNQRFFVEPKVFYTRSWEDVFYDNERLATYKFSDLGGTVDVGANLSDNSQVRFGYMYTRRKATVETGSPILPEDERDDAGLTMSATFDSRDTAFNPTRGIAAALEYAYVDESLGAELDWERLELGIGMAVPVRNDVVWMTLAGGTDLDSEIPPDRYFMLGGPGSFPGFELGELRLTDYWTASGSYLWKFKDLMSIRGQALYAGVRLEAGQVFGRLEQPVSPAFDDDEMIYGGSLYLTGRTQAGPLTLGLGMTSTDSWSLWIAVGRPIGNGTILERGIFR
ncbi:MAG: patatin-like phospholipase family protein [Proteobacteria bacterium]|nr:patatin-like phospholipase family protein [Pseudomonadota bacterium]